MRILYDYQGLIFKAGGVSRCICEYINNLKDYNDIIISCPMSDNIYMKNILNKKSLLSYIPDFKNKTKLANAINKLQSIIEIKKSNFDVFHPTFDASFYYGNIIKKPYVITIHDLIPELFLFKSENINTNHWLKSKYNAIKNAKRIMCVSENTKNDLLNYYDFVDSSIVDVVYHGIHPYTRNYMINDIGKYILYVGGRGSYKNFIFCVESLLPLFKKDKDLIFVCTGGAFSHDELQWIESLGLKNRIINKGYITDDELYSLYYNAQLFIYPSIYEGFGIPILEAFVNNCPACISNTSCFPEVGGDAVSYFDPYSKASILDSVMTVLNDSNYAEKLKNKGIERVKSFTWKESSNKVYSCYEKAIL